MQLCLAVLQVDGFFKLLKKNQSLVFLIIGVALFFIGVLLYTNFKIIEFSTYGISISLIFLIRYTANIEFIELFSKKYPNLYFLIWVIYIWIFSIWLPQFLIQFLERQ